MSDFLAELEAALRREGVPWPARRRLLAEIEDHLRCDSDASLGTPAELASRYARDLPRRTRPAALLLLGSVVAYVLPLYGIPENTLPPAPAEGLPASLHLLLDGALASFGVALAASVVAVLGGGVRPPAMAISVGALLASAGFGLAAAVQWPTARPLTFALAVPSAAAVLGVAVASLAWAAWPSSRRIATSQT